MEIQSFLWMFDVALSFLLILQWCLSSAFAWELSPILILYVWRDDYVGNFCLIYFSLFSTRPGKSRSNSLLNIFQFCFNEARPEPLKQFMWANLTWIKIYSSVVLTRPGQRRSLSFIFPSHMVDACWHVVCTLFLAGVCKSCKEISIIIRRFSFSHWEGGRTTNLSQISFFTLERGGRTKSNTFLPFKLHFSKIKASGKENTKKGVWVSSLVIFSYFRAYPLDFPR